jgi:hypothetical protein
MAHRFPVLTGPGVTSRGGVYGVLKSDNFQALENGDEIVESKPPSANSMAHMGLSILHLLVTATAIAISITALIFALGGLCNNSECKTLGYLTNTFASTSTVGGGAGWAVATERASLGDSIQYPTDRDEFVFSHYYECMSTARMGDVLCPRTEPLGEYIKCMHNHTGDALEACNYPRWPAPEDYLQCLFSFKEMHNSVSVRASQNVFRTCLSKTMWPFFEVQQGVDSPLFLGSFNWVVMLAVGLWILTSFAVYSASPIEAGHVTYGDPTYYKRLGWMWACVSIGWNVLMLVFMFMLVFRDMTIFEKPESAVPMTNSTATLCFLVLSVAVSYFGAEISEQRTTMLGAHVFQKMVNKGGGKDVLVKEGHITRVPNEDEDDTDNMQLVTKHRHGHHHHPHPDNASPMHMPSGVAMLGGALFDTRTKTYRITEEEVASFYTPPLLRVWADGLAFADPFIFLGMAGATGHLTTSVAWGLFFGVLIYRLMGMSIARFLYQCFMNNLSLSENENKDYHAITPNTMLYLNEVHHIVHTHAEKAKKRWRGEKDEARKEAEEKLEPPPYGNTPHLSVAVMALSTQLSAILLLAVVMYLAIGVESAIGDFWLFEAFMYVCFLIPEILRILGHLVLQIVHPDPNSVPWNMLNFYFLVWIWDVLTRVIFICIVLVGSGSTPGTRHFLMDSSIALMDTYLTAFKVY